MGRREPSLLDWVTRGIAAGVVGTGAMTAHQVLVAKLRGQPLRTTVPRT